MNRDLEIILGNLVRIGTVSAIDPAKKKARIIFKDKDDMVSGWLPVLQHTYADVYVNPDGTHSHAVDTGGTATPPGIHEHDAHVTIWMPKINDTVIAVYLPVHNADGFILGAI